MFLSHSSDHILPALDIWAAAIVLYAMLASAFPWERAAVSDRNYRAFAQGEVSGADAWERVPEGDRELLLGMVCVFRSLSPSLALTLALSFLFLCGCGCSLFSMVSSPPYA